MTRRRKTEISADVVNVVRNDVNLEMSAVRVRGVRKIMVHRTNIQDLYGAPIKTSSKNSAITEESSKMGLIKGLQSHTGMSTSGSDSTEVQ